MIADGETERRIRWPAPIGDFIRRRIVPRRSSHKIGFDQAGWSDMPDETNARTVNVLREAGVLLLFVAEAALLSGGIVFLAWYLT
jgi:hypothetical protein